METFVLRKNVEYFRRLLDEMITDESERKRILKLLAEEMQEQKDAGDFIKEDKGRH
jgi:hypothetical protein